jgi:transketolase
VVSVTSITPELNDRLAAIISDFSLVVTVEAHYVTGGLGSLVAEVIAERHLDCELVRCGVRAMPDGYSGSKAYLQARHGISSDALVKTITEKLASRAAS